MMQYFCNLHRIISPARIEKILQSLQTFVALTDISLLFFVAVLSKLLGILCGYVRERNRAYTLVSLMFSVLRTKLVGKTSDRCHHGKVSNFVMPTKTILLSYSALVHQSRESVLTASILTRASRITEKIAYLYRVKNLMMRKDADGDLHHDPFHYFQRRYLDLIIATMLK